MDCFASLAMRVKLFPERQGNGEAVVTKSRTYRFCGALTMSVPTDRFARNDR